MDITEMIKKLIDILSVRGDITLHIEKPSFTDGHYDGNDLDDNWDVYTNDDGLVVLK